MNTGRRRTPNPDVLCNREIKFKAFLDFAMQLGAEKIATGHFVRTDGAGRLLRGVDGNKDQSYFLYMIHKAQLEKSLFPVGGLTKPQVRQMCPEAGLPVEREKRLHRQCCLLLASGISRRSCRAFCPPSPEIW